jgi:hypothetical protein
MKSARTARRLGAIVTALMAAAVVVSGGRTAAAQSPVVDLPISSVAPPTFTGSIDVTDRRAFWRAGKARWFLAATGDVGAIYARTGAAAGYGKPHWLWGGIETSSAIAPGGGTTYAGLRFSSPWADVRGGARYVFTTSQHFLVPRETYTKDDTEERTGPKERYVSLEAEAAGGFPVPRGTVFGITGLYHVVGTPPGWNIFDQTLQVVAAPSLLWRARLGYLANVDRWDMFRVGAAVEVIGNPERDLIVVRAGPMITTFITHHLQAFGTALLVVHSKDQLGLAGAQTGELGFRYRWATGDRWPEFP